MVKHKKIGTKISDMPIFQTIIRKLNILSALVIAVLISGGLATMTYVIAATNDNSAFNQTINAGSLSIAITNASYSVVDNPSITMGAKTFSWTCLTAGDRPTGTFGASDERIYVQNPDAADNGWRVDLAASGTTDVWDAGAATDYDFNDDGGAGCTDGDDADAFGGEMTVDPSGGTITKGQCASCDTTSVTVGTSEAFKEGVTDAIDLMTGAAGSDDIGDWYLTGVAIHNTIPAEQVPGAYALTMTVSVTSL